MFKFCIKSFIITRVIYISFIIAIFHSNFISKYDLSPYIIAPTDNNETKETMRNPIFMTFNYDKLADSMFSKWFGIDSNIRKQLMQ